MPVLIPNYKCNLLFVQQQILHLHSDHSIFVYPLLSCRYFSAVTNNSEADIEIDKTPFYKKEIIFFIML